MYNAAILVYHSHLQILFTKKGFRFINELVFIRVNIIRICRLMFVVSLCYSYLNENITTANAKN